MRGRSPSAFHWRRSAGWRGFPPSTWTSSSRCGERCDGEPSVSCAWPIGAGFDWYRSRLPTTRPRFRSCPTRRSSSTSGASYPRPSCAWASSVRAPRRPTAGRWPGDWPASWRPGESTSCRAGHAGSIPLRTRPRSWRMDGRWPSSAPACCAPIPTRTRNCSRGSPPAGRY